MNTPKFFKHTCRKCAPRAGRTRGDQEV